MEGGPGEGGPGEGGQAIQSFPRPSEHDEPSTQPASAVPTWVDVAALQFDLEGGAVASSSFAASSEQVLCFGFCQGQGNDVMVPTMVDGSGVEVFPLSDDAPVEVSLESPISHPGGWS